MKKALLILFILFLGQSLIAQKLGLSIQSTERFKDKYSNMSFDIEPLGSDASFYYFTHLPYHEIYGHSGGNTQNYFVGKWSKDLKTYTKTEIELDNKRDGSKVIGIYYFNNRIIMVRSFEENIIAQYIDKKTLILDKETHILGKVQQGNERHLSVYNVSLSPDQTKLLMFYSIDNEKDIPQKFGARVFDEDLEELWQNKSIEPRFQGGVFSFEDFKLTDEGDLYFIGGISSEESVYYKDGGKLALKQAIGETYFIEKPGKLYQLYLITDEGEGIYQVNLTLPDQMIRGFNFCINEGQSVTGYGVYSNKRRISGIGTFVFDVNFEKEEVENIILKPFKEELLSQGFDKKELEKYNKQRMNELEWDPFNYDIGELKTKKDGTKYFVAEQWLKGRRSNSAGSYTTFYLYDLYVSSVGMKNEIISQYKIHKRQFVPLYISRCSYIDLEIDNTLYFLYTYLPRNNTASFKAKSLVLKSLDDTGKEELFYELLEANPFTPLLIADSYMKSGPNKIVVGSLCSKGKFYLASEITIITNKKD